MLKLLATVLHVMEEVETGAAGRKQNRVAGTGHVVTCLHAILHVVRVAYGNAQLIEEVVELRVVGTKVNQSHALLLNQLFDSVIVIAFVLTAKDEDDRCAHALQSIPASIDIGGLGVIDIMPPATSQTFSRRCSTPGKSLRLLRMISFLMPLMLEAKPAAREL